MDLYDVDQLAFCPVKLDCQAEHAIHVRHLVLLQISGGWNQQTVVQVYAQMPTGDCLAQRGRFSNRNTAMFFHTLLDPSELPEFKGMVLSVFPEAEATLQQVQQVCLHSPCPGPACELQQTGHVLQDTL